MEEGDRRKRRFNHLNSIHLSIIFDSKLALLSAHYLRCRRRPEDLLSNVNIIYLFVQISNTFDSEVTIPIGPQTRTRCR